MNALPGDPLPDTWTFPCCPQPPDWRLDWDAIVNRFAPIRRLAGVPQDPTVHAEGDALIHTRMVVEALVALAAWRSLAPPARSALFASALLHDIGKAAATVVESDGSIHSHGHARRGEREARKLLWTGEGLDAPAPFACREAVARLVRLHGLPLWFLEKPSPERTLIEASQSVRLDHLAILAEADARGRICPDSSELLARIALFRASCQELRCETAPFPFANEMSRFAYFRNPAGDPAYAAYDDTVCEVTLLSGLPGVGKDTWIRNHLPELPVVSLDQIRREMKIDPEGEQGAVVHAARAQAKQWLREKRSFVWNATNVTRPLREALIDLFVSHRARVRLVYLDAPWSTLLRRNRERPHPVPEPVILRLADKLEVPDPTEAHRVEWM